MSEQSSSVSRKTSVSSNPKPLWLRLLAELLGTGLLVFFGCISALQFSGGDPWGKLIAVSAAFGIIVAALVYMIGGVSGAQLNPAASLAMAIDKRISWKDFVCYSLAQIVGAFLGALVIWLFLGSAAGSIASTVVNNDALRGSEVGNLFLGVLLEAIGTFVFLFAVLAITAKKENGPIAGLAIGAALWLSIAILFNLTGGSLNPARSLGTALVALFNGETTPIAQIWVYIFGPLLGGAGAAFAFRLFSK